MTPLRFTCIALFALTFSIFCYQNDALSEPVGPASAGSQSAPEDSVSNRAQSASEESVSGLSQSVSEGTGAASDRSQHVSDPSLPNVDGKQAAAAEAVNSGIENVGSGGGSVSLLSLGGMLPGIPRPRRRLVAAQQDEASANENGGGEVPMLPRIYRVRSSDLGGMFGGIEESGLRLPQMFENMLSSAMSSMDQASRDIFSGLTGPKVDFAYNEDKSKLIARLRLPEGSKESNAERQLHVAVVGKSHLRISLETDSDQLHTSSKHTVALPDYVAREISDITPQSDGTVHITMTILKNEDGRSTSQDGQPAVDDFPSLFDRRMARPLYHETGRRAIGTGGETEIVQELPSGAEIEACHQSYPNEKLRIKKCTCEVATSAESKALCYGSLVSKCLSIARRLNLNDLATSAKHTAIECTDGHRDTASCLEKVSANLLAYLYRQNGVNGSSGNLSARIRNAIETDDDGPSEFRPSIGLFIARLCVLGLFVLLLLSAGLLVSYRYRSTAARSNVLSQMTSVLTQVSASAEAAIGGKSGSAIDRQSSVARHPTKLGQNRSAKRA